MMQQILFRVGVDVEHRVDFCMSGLEAIKHLEESLEIGVLVDHEVERHQRIFVS